MSNRNMSGNRRFAWIATIGVVLLIVAAEVAMRVDALNRMTFNKGGWILLGGFVAVLFIGLIIPWMRMKRLPVWKAPDGIEDISKRRMITRNYAGKVLSHFGYDKPSADNPSGEDVLARLRKAFDDQSCTDAAAAELEAATVAAHEWLVGPICDRLILDHMKRTAVLVAVSQRGWLDSAAMLYMQMKLVREIGCIMGYKPSWLLMAGCYRWIVGNSLVFGLLQGSEVVDSAMTEMVSVAMGEKTSSAIPFVGRLVSSVAQGAAAMATVYATGKIAQRYFAAQDKLSAEENLRLRVDGFCRGWNLYGSVLGSCCKSIGDNLGTIIKKTFAEAFGRVTNDGVSNDDDVNLGTAPKLVETRF